MFRIDSRIYLYKKKQNYRFKKTLSVLRKAYTEKQLVLLSGAGISIPSALPGTKKILSEYLYRLFPDINTNSLRKSELEKVGLPEGFDDFFHILAEKLGVSTVRYYMLAPYFPKSLIPNEAHFLSVLLWNQNKSLGFFTLNFDTLLEKAAEVSGIKLTVNANVFSKKPICDLNKLHGSWDKPDTLIFGKEKRLFPNKVKDAFSNKVILSMGTSFKDEDVQDLLRVSNGQIYNVDPYVKMDDNRSHLSPVQTMSVDGLKGITKISMKSDEFLSELMWTISAQDPNLSFDYYLLYTDFGQVKFRQRKNVRKLTDTLKGRENWLAVTMYTDPAAVVLGSAPGANSSREWKGGKASIRFTLNKTYRRVIRRLGLKPVELRLIPPVPFGKYLHSGKRGENVMICWRQGNKMAQSHLQCKHKTTVNTYYPTPHNSNGKHGGINTPIQYWSIAIDDLTVTASEKVLKFEVILPERTIMDFSRVVLKFAQKGTR